MSEQKLGDYRIVSNGLKYRIQRYEMRGLLWWRKAEWKNYYYSWMDDTYAYEYNTLPEAQKALDRLVAERDADLRGWSPVKIARNPMDEEV